MERGGLSSFDSSSDNNDAPLPPPVLVYHESARSIVFRDHLRRQASAISEVSSHGGPPYQLSKTHSLPSPHQTQRKEVVSAAAVYDRSDSDALPTVAVANFTPAIDPLPELDLKFGDEFTPLVEALPNEDNTTCMTDAEREVVRLLDREQAVVKTLRNADWTDFLLRFQTPERPRHRFCDMHNDRKMEDTKLYPFNSFVTSTTLLPSLGRKMRCYGSTNEYTTGVVFALPLFETKDEEDKEVERTMTWSWPSGYSAKTEFNIDNRGFLINGRKEALIPPSGLRKHNYAYTHYTDYEIAGRMVKGGLNTIPYNEVYVRVGGLGRIVNEKDCATGESRVDQDGTGRSLEHGLGLPVALFVRTACYGHLISLIRTRARISANLGHEHFEGIPLIFITPELGVRVLTEALQQELLQIVARNLNPFQNPSLARKTSIDFEQNITPSARYLHQKYEELIDLDSDQIRQILTPEECARLAGGFGATDDSVAHLLMGAMERDRQDRRTGGGEKDIKDKDTNSLQDIVNEGLAAAVRSGDYHTSRQMLILYTLVASRGHKQDVDEGYESESSAGSSFSGRGIMLMEEKKAGEKGEKLEQILTLKKQNSGTVGELLPPPPPPPLDTDRLRSATNSDGLLSVLGAAQILKAMQDEGAKARVIEAVAAVTEWVSEGEKNVAFRLASWRDQRAAQGDLQIAMEEDSNFFAFVSNKAISNRKTFAKQLQQAIDATDFSSVSFLQAIHAIVSKMHSPCLRLELLQYILGLDNRYSIAHVARSVELAATCLSISRNDLRYFHSDDAKKETAGLLE